MNRGRNKQMIFTIRNTFRKWFNTFRVMMTLTKSKITAVLTAYSYGATIDYPTNNIVPLKVYAVGTGVILDFI